MMRIFAVLLQSNDPEITLLGVLVPGIVLFISMVLTWLLYKRFSKK